jgi:hypothetical protein
MSLVRFFDGLRKKKTTQDRDAAVSMAAPGTLVYFDENLVTKLEKDHRILLRIFTKITEAYALEKYKLVSELMTQFRSIVYGHLLLENIKLYVYLRNVLRHDPHSFKIMREFQKEINEIGKLLDQFLDRYSNINWSKSVANKFGEELSIIGQALAVRIRREEEVLYPLYMPPSAYLG